MENHFKFHNKLILRTPRLPFNLDFDLKDILSFFNTKLAKEALYLASPSLLERYEDFAAGKITDQKKISRLYSALTKYYLRMHTRSTPFGLFSGVGVVDWKQEETEVVLDEQINRHTRLDMDYLCNLATYIERIPIIKKSLRYHPNSSLYKFHESLRYVEYKREDNKRTHQISEINSSEYILSIIEEARKGCTILELVKVLQKIDDEIESEEAAFFIEALIDEQVLCSELEPTITGEEILPRILKIIENITLAEDSPPSAIKKTLNLIHEKLKFLDSNKMNSIKDYQAIEELLKTIGIDYAQGRIFQTDMSLNIKNGHIDSTMQKDIWHGLELLNKITKKHENKSLTQFKKRFNERYENNEVPLMELMDTENGIGYGFPLIQDDNYLSQDLLIPDSDDGTIEVKWNDIDDWLVNLLLKAQKEDAEEIVISKKDFPSRLSDWQNMPPSFSVMFKLVEQDKILIESVGNSSAVNFLGRFAQCSTSINEIVNDIATHEQNNNKNVILAEIVHLPQDRIGNILQRPIFRAYEIPYLAKSSVPAKYQIRLDDLFVSIVGNRIVLKSKKFDHEIIPRLGTAHNYNLRTQPIYRFLCDLQFQNFRQILYFDWGVLGGTVKMFPRVRVGKVILAPRTWIFKQIDFKHLTQLRNEDVKIKFNDFRKKYKLPVLFSFTEFDNELLVDANNLLAINAFLHAIKNKLSITLREFLYDHTSKVTNMLDQDYCNQFIALAIKKESSFNSMPSRVSSDSQIKKGIKNNFSIGSEWIYYKIYGGFKSLDQILTEAIYPCCEELIKENLIDKWFFIRYSDPEFHIRLRFHQSGNLNFEVIDKVLKKYLDPYEKGKIIWNIQIENYRREVERYGRNSMELSESIFYLDSKRICSFLAHSKNQESNDARWLWGVKAIDELLNGLKFTIKERIELFTLLNGYYVNEFNANKVLNHQLKEKYRKDKDRISDTISIKPLSDFPFIEKNNPSINSFFQKIVELEEEGNLNLSKIDLAMSYIHMLLNRLFISYARTQEMVIYNFLMRHYKSALAKEIYNTSIPK